MVIKALKTGCVCVCVYVCCSSSADHVMFFSFSLFLSFFMFPSDSSGVRSRFSSSALVFEGHSFRLSVLRHGNQFSGMSGK